MTGLVIYLRMFLPFCCCLYLLGPLLCLIPVFVNVKFLPLNLLSTEVRRGTSGGSFVFCLYIVVLTVVVIESWVCTPTLSRVPVSLYFLETRLPFFYSEDIGTVSRRVRLVMVYVRFKGY